MWHCDDSGVGGYRGSIFHCRDYGRLDRVSVFGFKQKQLLNNQMINLF